MALLMGVPSLVGLLSNWESLSEMGVPFGVSAAWATSAAFVSSEPVKSSLTRKEIIKSKESPAGILLILVCAVVMLVNVHPTEGTYVIPLGI